MRKTFLTIAAILGVAVSFTSCMKDELGYAGRNYCWDMGLPYSMSSEIGSPWLDNDHYVHAPSKFDTLIHSMRLAFTGSNNVSFDESFSAYYSSAYRYIGPEDGHKYFLCHEEHWQRFDTAYSVYANKGSVPATYSAESNKLHFKLSNIYINQSIIIGGQSNYYDYHYIPWDSDEDYSATIVSDSELQCAFGELVRTFRRQ